MSFAKAFLRFLSTPSARRATDFYYPVFANLGISIHALREEGDVPDLFCADHDVLFLSTPSARRATSRGQQARGVTEYFYPRPPRGGRRKVRRAQRHFRRNFYPRPPRGGRHYYDYNKLYIISISIHALREEGDYPTWLRFCGCCYFYPRPPRGGRHQSLESCQKASENFYPRPPRGGRRSGCPVASCRWIFLSTPSARRATALPEMSTSSGVDFYPRPPRGGRQGVYICEACGTDISIHALREEGDFGHRERQHDSWDFYPRPPRGGRRRATTSTPERWAISIHALREEGDSRFRAKTSALRLFLSTPSARRATQHPPGSVRGLPYFYPRPPRGGRHLR